MKSGKTKEYLDKSDPDYVWKVRKQKALREPIYLVEVSSDNVKEYEKEFTVMGTMGKEYKVVIKRHPSCRCFDWIMKKRSLNHLCKHIYFVLRRVLKCSDKLFDKKKFGKRDLLELFSGIDNIPQNTLYHPINMIDDNIIIDNYNKKVIVRKFISVDDTCPICLDNLLNGEDLLFCKSSCGNNIHQTCFRMWCKKKAEKICVYCRGDWKDQNALSKEEVIKELKQLANGGVIEKDNEHEPSLNEGTYTKNNKRNIISTQQEITTILKTKTDDYRILPNKPKKAIEFFTDDVKENLRSNGFAGKQLNNEISNQWKNLSEEQKGLYYELNEKDIERYEKQSEQYQKKGYYF